MLETERLHTTYHAVYDALGDGVLIVGYPSLGVQHGNRAAQTLTGYSLDELCQTTLPDLYPELDDNDIPHDVLHPPICLRAALRPRTGDAISTELQLTLCAIEDIPSLVCMIRDMTGQRTIEEELHTHERLYRSLVDGIPDLLFRINRNGTYLDFKVPSELGLPIPEASEIVGKTIGELMPAHVNDMAMAAIERVFETGRMQAIEYQIKEPNGLHEYEARFAPSIENEVLAIVRDITHQKHTEGLSAIQRDLGIALSIETNLVRALQLVLDAVIDVADMDGGGIYLVDHTTGGFDLVLSKGLPEDFVRWFSHFDADTHHARVIREGQSRYICRQELDHPHYEPERRAKLHALAVLPVRHRQEVIACLNLASRRVDHIPDATRTALEAIASQTGSAIARIKIEEALRESEKTTRALLNALPDSAVLLDKGGIILSINETAANYLGLTTNALIGTNITDHLPFDIAPIWHECRTNLLETEKTLDFDVEQNGRHYVVVIHPLFDRQGTGQTSRTAIIVYDVTKQKQTEQVLLYRRALLEATAQATTRLLAGGEHTAAIQDALALLGQATQTDRVFIFENHPASSPAAPVSSLRYEWCSPETRVRLEYASCQDLHWDSFGVADWYRALADGDIICLPNPKIPGKAGGRLRLDPMRSLLLVPTFANGRFWGCLGFVDHQKSRRWPEEEIAVIRAMAASIGAAIERQQAEDKLRHEREIAETLREVGTVLNSTLDLNEVLQLLLEQVKRVVPYDSANVMLIKNGTARIASSANYERMGLSKKLIYERAYPIEKFPSMQKLLHSGMPQVISDVTCSPDWVTLPGIEWIQSWLGVPIVVRGEVIGFFSLDSAQEGFYGPHHVKIITPFARQAAIACENAWLYQQTHEQAERLSLQLNQLDTLYQAGKSILSTLELDEILARFAEQIAHIADAQSTIIYECDDGLRTGTIQTVHDTTGMQYLQQPDNPAHEIDLSTPLIRSAITSGHSVILAGADLVAAFPDTACIRAAQSIMLVPLANKQRTIGLVVIRNDQAGHCCTSDQRRMCEALANQAAIALEQAMLFADIQKLEHAKSQMIRMASHDLRSPLTRVQGHLQRLEDSFNSHLTPDQLNDLAGIDDASRQMEEIIDDILSLERIEAKHRAAKPIPWADLIQKCVEALHTELHAKHHTLTIQCPPDLPVVCGDQAQINRAIFNLIHNATKYTPIDGTITVRVYEKEYGGAPTLAFEVIDTGIGIPLDQQVELFQPFYRAQQAGTEDIAGVGLGLSIVKSAVELHEGNVYWDSIPGQGSTFGFWIPIWPGDTKQTL